MITWVTPGDASFPGVAALFDEYRVHYGEPSAPTATQAWLAEQISAGRFAVAAPSDAGGLITTTVIPASLTLGTAWLVRDLFVPPRSRRQGIARALLDHVIVAARAAGARRVSLQTEPDNDGALALYTGAGFRPVTSLSMLNLPL
ncbi:GNAT family N-acetyltransferase [Actinoplanes bogorensis]|uniref:GNAT family N-acetyltransferase n=1 Tax=Paractinoplanes bogorensis TaxID=1610840 RepID=A0ABS5YGW4_9ACTN|nr:GNAT family N-acetyltransferase [Actinoplanes bogorensis]MBU2662724.1 GNAT family N-acetyltransferase [Actinoplanes bogorensis]